MPVASAPAGGVQMIPKFLKKIGSGIASGAKAVGSGIASGAKAVGRGISAPFRALGRAIGGGGKKQPPPPPPQTQTQAPPPQPDAPQPKPLGTSMPKLTGGPYSETEMQERTTTLFPELQREVARYSELDVSDGNRYAYMREGGGGDTRSKYFQMLKAAGRESNKTTLANMSQNLDALPNVSEDGISSYKSLLINGNGQDDQRLAAFQNRAVDMTGIYLNSLENDPDAIDALRKGASMYQGLGTYSKDNKGGLAGGNLEGAHRAMNDMILRSLGPDALLGHKDLALNQQDDTKVNITAQAMAAMQPDVLAAVIDPKKMADLNPQQQRLATMYQQFFQRNGMLG